MTRAGACVASYDKIHAFTPMGEHQTFTQGERLCRFTLEGRDCGLIICYDIRFPELTRTLALQGLDLLFVVSQWPDKRSLHLQALSRARAIENQMFLALCNSCGTAGDTRYGGGSALIDPWGETVARRGPGRRSSPGTWTFPSSRASAPPSTSSGTGGPPSTAAANKENLKKLL